MKFNILQYITFLLVAISFASCDDAFFSSPSSAHRDVYDQFWTEIDKKYSFFREKNIDWNNAYNRISNINNNMPDEVFFDTLCSVLGLLQDGHSSLTSTFDAHKYPGFFLQSPPNYSERLIYDYYSKGWPNYTGALSHFLLAGNKVAYIHYSSFMYDVTDADIDYVLEKYANTRGIIFDVRENTGGNVNNVFRLVSRFAQQRTLVYKTRSKSGPNHDDFTEPFEVYIEHSGKSYTGNICVLTNRKTYSAGSVFTLCMRELPDVSIVGDTTGGGLGLPIGVELSNGWQLRFSGTQILSADEECFETGIPPDVAVGLTPADEQNGVDPIIEKAIDILLGQ